VEAAFVAARSFRVASTEYAGHLAVPVRDATPGSVTALSALGVGLALVVACNRSQTLWGERTGIIFVPTIALEAETAIWPVTSAGSQITVAWPIAIEDRAINFRAKRRRQGEAGEKISGAKIILTRRRAVIPRSSCLP
jgi:hypothetical protein